MNWGGAAISNATWSGPKLCDLLTHLGWDEEKFPSVKHVWADGEFLFSPVSVRHERLGSILMRL